MNIDETEYDYKKNEYANFYSENIQFFLQDQIYGKTLEYDLIRFNPNFKGLVTDSAANKDEIVTLMDQYANGESLEMMLNTLRDSDENNRIKQALRDERLTWEDDEKKKALVAARYLNSVGKGVNALELAYELEKT